MKEYLSNRFEIGDKCQNRLTGNKVTGTVVGILNGVVWYKMRGGTEPELEDHPWTKLFPSWTNRCVYFLLLEEPSRPLSLEEFLKTHRNEADYYKLKQEPMLTYPEDDLILINKELASPSECICGSYELMRSGCTCGA